MARLSLEDVIPRSYTPEMTQVGIAYALQRLPATAVVSRQEMYRALRWIVIEQAAALAFRQHLISEKVPHQLVVNSQFASPLKTCVRIGGRICDMSSSAIVQRTKIRQLHLNPASLLSNIAVISSEALTGEQRNDTDLLVFSFVTALVAGSLSTTQQAASAGQPVALIYPLPANWSVRSAWSDLGQLVLKSETDQLLHLTLVGQNEDCNHLSEEVALPPGFKVAGVNHYHCLTYLRLEQLPSGRLGIYSPSLRKTLVISPFHWGNIWVYGMNIYLAGWMTRTEFSHCASHHTLVHDAWQPTTPGSKYMALPVSELHPLEELFSKARDWAER